MRLSKIKYWSATLMTIGIVSFFVHALDPKFMSGFSWIFWIEYTGFFGFGLYWWRLMLLVNDANESGQQMKSQTTTEWQVKRSEPTSIALGTENSSRNREASSQDRALGGHSITSTHTEPGTAWPNNLIDLALPPPAQYFSFSGVMKASS